MKLNAIKFIALTGASLLFLTSCEHLGPQPYEKIPLDEQPYAPLSSHTSAETVFQQQANNISEQTENKQKDQYFRGTGKFVSSAANKSAASQAPRQGKFSLNFEDADLSEVVKVILSDLLSASYMMSPKVVGKVTLQTSRPLAREELLPTLDLLLQVNNAVLIRDDKLYRIKPVAGALQGSTSPLLANKGKRLPAGYQVRIMPLEYIGVEEMQEILKPMISATALVRGDVSRNLLMLAGTGGELENIRQTVSIFDVDYMQGMSFGLFPLNNVDAETINKELEEIFSTASGSPLAGMFKLMPIERLNAIMVITPQQKYLNKAKRWIARLDNANAAAGGGVVVYRAQHIKAVDLADTLTEIFSGTKKKTREPSVALGRKATKVSNKKDKKPKKAAPKVSAKKKSRASVAEVNDARFIADEANNTVIIVATAQEYDAIRNVIKQLDVMPLQVLIDASIFEVRITDKAEFGITWQFNNSFDGGIGGSGNLGGLGLGDAVTDAVLAATNAAATGGFSYVFSAAADGVRAAIDAAADRGNLNVLSSPSLMVLNNQEATIKVGDQVPIRTTESTNTGSGVGDSTNPIQTSSIEYRDTGVTLTVTPRVNASGVVIMEIEQKVDSVQKAAGASGSSIDSPTILQRQISSSVAIHSGETVILGGLINDSYDISKKGIPWLMDIPYLGPLFGVTTKEKVKQELVVLITPRVVQNKLDARQVTREYKQKLDTVFEDVEAMKKADLKLRELENKVAE